MSTSLLYRRFGIVAYHYVRQDYHLGNYDPHIVPDAYLTKGLKK
jgi:hypothetical protein